MVLISQKSLIPLWKLRIIVEVDYYYCWFLLQLGMLKQLIEYSASYFEHEIIGTAVGALATVSIILVAGWISYAITGTYLKKIITKFFGRKHSALLGNIREHTLVERAAYLAPGLVILWFSIDLQKTSYATASNLGLLLEKAFIFYAAIQLGALISSILNIAHDVYKTLPVADRRPIKSYLQLVKLVINIIIAIIATSIFLEKSPIALLTGLGALTAVIMLVFRDSILGFVASLQLTLNDMVRIGDWLDIPKYGASGDLIDISLTTAKIRNFDKTITTVPTYALLSSGVKNWRGMVESGGRRIRRYINLDANLVKFCDDAMLKRLVQIPLLSEHIKKLQASNSKMTNIGLLRHYLVAYIEQHPDIRTDYTLLVRQLQLTENGLPIEIYAFTNVTNWRAYESIQADIFEHIFAMIPQFDLCVMQFSVNIHTSPANP